MDPGLSLAIALFATATPPVLSADGDGAAGYVRLSWTAGAGAGAAPFELQSSAAPGFESTNVIYEGAQTASFLSGLTDGDLFFRVRGTAPDGSSGPWSKTVRFSVAHHSVATAGALFGLGAFVFLVTLAFLWRESRRAR